MQSEDRRIWMRTRLLGGCPAVRPPTRTSPHRTVRVGLAILQIQQQSVSADLRFFKFGANLDSLEFVHSPLLQNSAA